VVSCGWRTAGAGLTHIEDRVTEEIGMALMRWNPMMLWRPTQEPWRPFTGIASLRTEMDRLFNTYFENMLASGASESLRYPRVDLQEHDQAFVLVADLPGMKQDDIQITVEDHVLTLQGTREEEQKAQNGQNGSAHYTERSYGTFCRRFTLGAAVDADTITATYKDGVLAVQMPKTAAAQPKRITVQSAA
jgi:HSP20 family protein